MPFSEFGDFCGIFLDGMTIALFAWHPNTFFQFGSIAMNQRQGNAEKKAAKKSKKGGQKITRMKTNTRQEVRQKKTAHKFSRQTGD